jgi:hypothetical protein
VTAAALTLVALVRRRIVLFMLVLVPTVFATLIVLTTTERPLRFQLAALGQNLLVVVPQRHEGLVFICLTAVGLLTAFLALDLVRRDAAASQRLVLCGYRSAELLIARLAVLLVVIVAIAGYVCWLLPVFFAPERLGLVVVGLALAGWVYGCYGMLVGAVLLRELEGVLFVALLAAIDVGWLQNPIYYADAQHQAVIRSLPGYFPSQVAMGAAFSRAALWRSAFWSVAYGGVLLAGALAVTAIRARQSGRAAASA